MLNNKTRFVYLILTIIMMIIIFLFSSQPSKDSNFLSFSITNEIYKRVENKTESKENIEPIEQDKVDESKNTETTKDSSSEKVFTESNIKFRKINEVVRKSAHVFIYMMLGIFLILFIKTYNISFIKALIITVAFCFTYACLDEFNQYLRETRTALFTDVLIDTFGCLIGCLIERRR